MKKITSVEELMEKFMRYHMEAGFSGNVLHVEDKEGEWLHYDEVVETLKTLLVPTPKNTPTNS